MLSKKVRFLRAIICDDVRQEVDGRYSLMGVIGGEMNFSSEQPNPGPPNLDLAFYIECEVHASTSVQFRFLMPDGETTVTEQSGEFKHLSVDQEPRLAPVAINRQTLELPVSGAYRFQAKEDDGDWQTLSELNVTIKTAVVKAASK